MRPPLATFVLIAAAITLGIAWHAPALSTEATGDCLNLPDVPFNYANIPLPFYLQVPVLLDADNTPPNNPITDAGATLGRVLFYDKKLSANETVACASCHKQEASFSDNNVLSEGFAGLTGRHSMSLAMARYYQNGHFFWDERAPNLEAQVLTPIQDPIEMGMNLDELVSRLANTDYYPPLFEAAFGTPGVTANRVSRALAQFVRSMVSYQSKYDLARQQAPPGPPELAPFPGFTPQENLGKTIFFDPTRGNCAACHGTDAFNAPGPRNNGLDLVSEDPGVGGVTGNPLQIGEFKSPSLRNISLTAPYMHDGRFATLEAVIEHYNSGVQPHPNLSGPLRQGPGGPPRRLNLTPAEKAALLAFLQTLEDPSFIADERWSDPFCTGPVAATEPVRQDGWHIFPNPASSTVNVRIDADTGQAYQLRLLSAGGQLLRSYSFEGPEYQFQREGWPAGLYYLHLSDGRVKPLVLK